jgi:hypothetical protein
MADRKITDLTALAAGSQATGDLLTIVDVSEAAAADKNKKMTMENLFKGIPSNVGIGTSSPDNILSLDDTQASGGVGIDITNQGDGGSSTTPYVFINAKLNPARPGGEIRFGREGNYGDAASADSFMAFYTALNSTNTEAIRIDSLGRLLVGATSSYASANADDLQVGDNTDSAQSGITLGSTTASSIRFRDGADAGIILYLHSDNSMRFSTADSEAMRIDSSGSVGIGTTSPALKLHVDDSGSQIIRFSRTGTGAGSLDVDSSGNAVLNSHTTGKSVVFHTQTNERMRVESSGAVLINRTSKSDSEKLSVKYSPTNQGVIIDTDAAFTGNSNLMVFKANNTVGGSITFTNNGTSTAYVGSSDYRLKENVVDLVGAITRVKQLSPKRFNFIADANTTVDGFLAHEAQTVVPEAVTGTHNEVDDDNNPVYQGIDQSKLVPLLTAALQEAIAKIETLETKVAALEAQ